MELGYPVNDYRGYLAHATKKSLNAQNWGEAENHKYYQREWVGKGWRYYYTKEEYDAAHKKAPSSGTGGKTFDREQFSDARKPAGPVSAGTGGRTFDTSESNMGGVTVQSQAASDTRKALNTVGYHVGQAANAVAGAAVDAYHAVEGAIGSGVDWAKNFVQEQAQVYQFDKDKGEIMRDPDDPQKPLYADTIAGNTVRIANEIADWATQAFSDVKNWIKNAAQDVGKWMTDRRKDLIKKYNEVKSFVSGIANKLTTSPQVQAVISTLKSGFGAVKTGLVDAYNAVAGFVTSLPDKAAGAIKGLSDILGLSNQIDNAFDQAQEDALNNQEEEQKRGGHGGSF